MLLLAFVLTGAGNAWGADDTVTFSELGLSNGVQYTMFNGTDCTLTFGDGANDGKYYDTGAAIRVYGGGHMTVSSGTKTIEEIELTFGSGDGSNDITVDGGSYSDGKWTGSASSVTFTVGGTKGHRRIASVAVTYAASGDTRNATTLTISVPEDFNNDIAKGKIAGQLSATVSAVTHELTDAVVTWSSSNEEAASVDNEGNVTLEDVGEAIITAKFEGNNDYKESSATYKFTVVDSDQPGMTADNPYTVAQARAAIDAGEGVKNVYAKGIVSEIVTAYSSEYGNISYNISEDGSTTADQLQAFRGKGKDGANFTSEDDVKVGDVVVIYGNLKKYNDTYEFDAGNQLVSLERDESKQDAGLAYEETSFSVNVGESFVAPTLTNPNNLDVTYTSSNENVATVDATSGRVTVVAAGVTTIKASFEGNDSYFAGEASYMLKVVDPNANDGTAEKPYTVAEAINYINGLGSSTSAEDVYVKGIVSQVDSYNSNYNSITYWISDDGETTTQMQVYSGKGLESADFSSKDDLKVGDKVVVCGKVKMYNTTPEFDKNNYLVSYETTETPVTEVAAPTFSVAEGEVESGTTVALIQNAADDIYYTTDGSEPDAVTGGSTRYTAPIVIDKDMTIKAIAVLGDAVSAVATATYTIKVVEPEPVLDPIVAPGEDIVFGDLELENGVQYKNPFVNSSNTFTITFAGGDNDGKYYTTGAGIRVYGNGTMKISANGDKMLTKVVVKYSGTNKPESGDVVDTGSYDAETGIWTGEAESVTFTRPSISGHWRVQSVSATCGYEVEITSAGWATYVPSVDVNFNASGVTAYTAKVNGAYVDLTEVNAVPAGTPVVLKGDAGTHELTKTSGVAAVEGNELLASDGSVTGDGSIYALGQDKSILTHVVYGFYKVATDATVPAGKAYLKVSNAGVRDFLAFAEGETDGIQSLRETAEDGAVYNLAGQRVQKAQRGIYVKNGRKVVVK